MKITRELLEDLKVSERNLEKFQKLGGDGELRDLISKGSHWNFNFLNWILSKVLTNEEYKKFSINSVESGLFIFKKIYPQEDSLDIILERIKNNSFKYDEVYFSFTKILNQANNDVVENINKSWEKNQSLNLEDFQRNTEVNKYLGAANICMAVQALITDDFFGGSESLRTHLKIVFRLVSNALDYYITVYNNYWEKFGPVYGNASDLKKQILLYGCKLIEERV